MRRSVLGDAYVDSQVAAKGALQEFQDHITAAAWGAWAREGALSKRDRSLLVLAITAALGRMEEFELHARAQPRTGVTDDELDEMLFHIAAYCGVPAGVAAERSLLAVRSEREQDGSTG
jgi:4-carboxymuconolactone decarboxylase